MNYTTSEQTIIIDTKNIEILNNSIVQNMRLAARCARRMFQISPLTAMSTTELQIQPERIHYFRIVQNHQVFETYQVLDNRVLCGLPL